MNNKEDLLQEKLINLLKVYNDKRFDEAEKQCVILTKSFPNHVLPWKLLAILLRQKGLFKEALKINLEAFKLEPEDIEILNNLAIMYKDNNKLNEAEDIYKKIINLDPCFESAYNNYGNLLNKLERFQEAEKYLKKSIDLKPNFIDAYNNIATTFVKLDRLEEAIESYEKVKEYDPMNADSYNNLGIIYRRLNKLIDAKKNFEKAVTLKPDFPEFHYNYGNILRQLKRLDEAEAHYRKAIDLKYNLPRAHNNLGITLHKLGRYKDAEESYRKAINLNSSYDEAHNNLGTVLQDLGDFKGAEARYRKAIELKSDYFHAHSNLLFLNCVDNFEYKKYLKDAQKYSDSLEKKINYKYKNWKIKKDSKTLRIGFISSNFNNHPVGYFLEGFLNKLSASSMELFAYTNINYEDELTNRIKPFFYKWVSLFGKNDKDAAQAIYDDNINILIDLSGHTDGNRLPIFFLKPAPVQITWLGYFASTGLKEIDYILGDPHVTPYDEGDHFIEKIYQLPESYLCYNPPNYNIEVGPLPALSNGFITYGSFNKLYKITDNVISVWSKILKFTPKSKLFLKDIHLNYPDAIEDILSRFSAYGINENSLILEGASPREEYLKSYNRIDIGLSPFPYGGGTTSVDSIWMGVPVITRKGKNFLSHLGETIAHNSGNTEWIALDNDEYIKKALKLSSNLTELKDLRESLRIKACNKPLFNNDRFASHFEKVLLDIWHQWKKKNTF
tara:strand:- start:842 stop:3025 length:2184 start_codon:yes stop_codon:yes gene_type:complete